jgi:8-oxo-dGTP diphosphatase
MSVAHISHDSESLATGQQVITASAFIHRNFDGVEKVFLPKRAATKKFLPGVYELPGGHLDFGEDIVAGLKREIVEEFGEEITVGDPFACFTYTNEVKGSHSVEVIYFATFTNDTTEVSLHPEDHSEYGWFAGDELHKVINDIKGEDDPEILALQQGFALLRGESLKFG